MSDHMDKLPQAFLDKIEVDRQLSEPVIEISSGKSLVQRARKARRECQAYMKPAKSNGATA